MWVSMMRGMYNCVVSTLGCHVLVSWLHSHNVNLVVAGAHAAAYAKKYIMQMEAVQHNILAQMMMKQRYKATMILLGLVAIHLKMMTNLNLLIAL
jgi:hypothetical protein